MPLTRGADTRGAYYRWGHAHKGGTKYHYTAGNARSREAAKVKAMRQARAIEASKSRRRATFGGSAAAKPAAAKPAAAKPAARPRTRARRAKAPLTSARRVAKKTADSSQVRRAAAYRHSTVAKRR